MTTEARWTPTAYRLLGGRQRYCVWEHPAYYVLVRHCGHPTASWPYYLAYAGGPSVQPLRTFRTLAEAKAAVEAGGYAWPEKPLNQPNANA